ncbi:ABC transporter ATP-binding protein [Allopusillimonas soli]|uniref:Spermidine/putrescine import ATP-binding protein PotA n=1 Tax=Allopusillimonas soli TaxID=659016 RepID=A0A853FGL2_9BURK|nr:ABC transporter ATP-binding protein [Allopusillimonas soli]NYT37136.1 ABC transporter ATP-binding protein [Allopusillimonas soli]TEA75564.1 ABC transporter ATP-binding protein [Allopusillimonas soli]
MAASNLQIQGLAKRYGNFVALAPTHLEVASGEFLTLLGPSGSGKTTLLSLIAGLSRPDEGRLIVNGRDITDGAPYERDIGMVFQNYALFPHMTIEENIAFPLKMRNMDGAQMRRRTADVLDLVRLPHVAQRYPKALSGGQQQRIALARCMVYNPSIILMDEPLGALDKKLRDQMQLEIKRIHRQSGTTIIYVTHDQEEAMTMSDRICLMNAGAIAQLGSPADLYFRPCSVFVADFLGESNMFDAVLTDVQRGSAGIRLAMGAMGRATLHNDDLKPGDSVKVMIRPQNVHPMMPGEHAPDAMHGGPGLSGKVLDVMVTGSLTKLYVQGKGENALIAAFPTRAGAPGFTVGQEVMLGWHESDAVALPA